MKSIYIGSNYPDNYGVENIVNAITGTVFIVDEPSKADFFLFPVFYEVLFEYDDNQRNANGYTEQQITLLKSKFNEMVTMTTLYNKKIILFYYRDPSDKIPVINSIIFRTSLLKSERDKNEYAMPAFVKDVKMARTIASENLYLNKTEKPSVAFRGQAAPIKLPFKLNIKYTINKVFKGLNIGRRFSLYYNFGYMARREATIACLNNKAINADMALTTDKDTRDVNSKEKFLDNLFGNQYNLCVSGHGNYSFRLYETLSAGRIPIFINTDCVLPFEEFIDWKKHVVWVDEQDADKADKLILDFHKNINSEDFLEVQKSNRLLFEKYLTIEGFFKNLHKYLAVIQN